MIYNLEELNKFISFLPEMNKDEVIFISLSARNKYLTDEERFLFDLGRTEMFSREIIFEKNVDNFIHILKKISTVRSYRTTKNGSYIPDKCLVTYINLNYTDVIRSAFKINASINDELQAYTLNLKNNHDLENNINRLKNIVKTINNTFQTTTSKRNFIDIDIDSHDVKVLDFILNKLNEKNVIYFVIETFGGFHVVCKKETVKFNYNEIINSANEFINENKIVGKVENNINFMVPLPGTLQANKLVKIILDNYK